MQIKINLKIFIFAIIFIITKSIGIYTLLMIFALIHEMGHLICGLVLGFKPQSMTIMPYGFKINFNINYNDYNVKVKKGSMLSVKKICIALAGPLVNLICILIFAILKQNNINFSILGYDTEYIIYSNLIIALFNLTPIYPLDGGKIMQEVLHIFCGLRKSYKYMADVSWINISVLTALSSLLILYYKNIVLLIVIGYLWYLVLKSEKEFTFKEKIYQNIEKYAKKSGIHNQKVLQKI